MKNNNSLISYMRLKKKARIPVSLFLLVGSSVVFGSSLSQSTASDEEITLCAESEDVYFSCQVKNKIASVCAYGNTAPTKGYVQYRYGMPGAVEMIYPEEKLPPRDFFFITSASEGSVLLENLKLKKGRYIYILSQAFVSRVIVQKEQKVIFRESCGQGGYKFISRKARLGIDKTPKSDEDFR